MLSSVKETSLAPFLKLTAFVAHTDAYNKARILHRDISARNIIISDSGTGILIDWDLSKKLEDNPDARPGQYSQIVSVHRDTCHT